MCIFCGRKHSLDRSKCSAKSVTYHDCEKGHFRKVRRSSRKASKPVASLSEARFAQILASSGRPLENAMVTVDIGDLKLEAREDYIDSRVANDLRLKIIGLRTSIRLASGDYNAEVTGFVCAKLNLESLEYTFV